MPRTRGSNRSPLTTRRSRQGRRPTATHPRRTIGSPRSDSRASSCACAPRVAPARIASRSLASTASTTTRTPRVRRPRTRCSARTWRFPTCTSSLGSSAARVSRRQSCPSGRNRCGSPSSPGTAARRILRVCRRPGARVGCRIPFTRSGGRERAGSAGTCCATRTHAELRHDLPVRSVHHRRHGQAFGSGVPIPARAAACPRRGGRVGPLADPGASGDRTTEEWPVVPCLVCEDGCGRRL